MKINDLIDKIEMKILPKLRSIKEEFGDIEIKLNTPKENYNLDNVTIVEVIHGEVLSIVLAVN